MWPAVEVVARHRLLPRLLLLVHRPLVLQRCLPAEGVVAGADVEERQVLLRQRQLRLQVAVVAEVLPRPLRHRDCWAVSSWWPTREGLIRRISPSSEVPMGKIQVNFATLKRDGSEPRSFHGFNFVDDCQNRLARRQGCTTRMDEVDYMLAGGGCLLVAGTGGYTPVRTNFSHPESMP